MTKEIDIENEECESCEGTCFEWVKGESGNLEPAPCEECGGTGAKDN